ncbi:hypothetical protein JDV09_15290 [Mycobacterium sp. Y57]|uniref:hypothetical protein n=1 Tax=Mycolicibacterium xanthum TaxID=2796469 RepID=UPI001C84894E|nr:hypothetical protein [Mycolicibacterium xanthum]MBX7433464.1 hypothetical protein [Mycolicibacterium xanthum]
MVRYVYAAAVPAAIAAAGLGPLRCGVHGCAGGSGSTLQLVLVGAGVGAAIGVIAMALVELVVNGRYLLANRAEAKARRLREQARRPSPEPPASSRP